MAVMSPPFVQGMLLLKQLSASLKQFSGNVERALNSRRKRPAVPYFALEGLRRPDFQVDSLQRDYVEGLLSLNFQKWEKDATNQSGLLRGDQPTKGGAVVYSLSALGSGEATTKQTVQKFHGLRFAHRNRDGSSERSALGFGANPNAAFAVNNARSVRQIVGGDAFQFFRPLALSFCPRVPLTLRPLFISLFAGAHRIYSATIWPSVCSPVGTIAWVIL